MMSVRYWMQDRRVAAGLAALAVLLLVYRFYPGSAGKAPKVSPPTAPGIGLPQGAPGPEIASPPLPAVAETTDPPGPPAWRETAWSWGRNPFLPLWREGGSEDPAAVTAGESRGAEVPHGLRGTVVTGNSGIAIFGSRLVPLGGAIGEWTLERVDPYGVSLRKGQEVLVVELFKPAPTGAKGRGGDR